MCKRVNGPKFLFCALVGLSLVMPAVARANQISYYPFEGNAKDAVGVYHGNALGATLTTGHTGQAYQFDGNDYIQVSRNISASSMPRLTMGAWVYPTAGGSGQAISQANGSTGRSLGMYTPVGGATCWSAFAGASVLTNSAVQLNEWSFVAVVYDQPGSTVRLYVNGVETSKSATVQNGLTSGLRIGAHGASGQFFCGKIDDVFFYNEALTKAQLDALYQPAPIDPPADPSAAPLPAAAWMGMAVLGLLGAGRLRRRD